MSRNSKMTLWAESSALLRGARRAVGKKKTVGQRLLRSVNQNALPSGGVTPPARGSSLFTTNRAAKLRSISGLGSDFIWRWGECFCRRRR